MDKFLLAENPMRSEQSGYYIIHMPEPVAIIKCNEDHIQFPPGKYYKYFSFKNKDGIVEEWTLSIYHLFTTQMDSEQHESIVLHILDRAWRWYRSYMEWEDDQINNQ